LKAVLAARGVAFMKSHALSYLVGLVEESEIDSSECLSEADVLSPWAVEFRYEGEEPPALDRSAALTLVEQVREWTEVRSKPQIRRHPSNNSINSNRGRATRRLRSGAVHGFGQSSNTLSCRSFVFGFIEPRTTNNR
jgi:HEPN domain